MNGRERTMTHVASFPAYLRIILLPPKDIQLIGVFKVVSALYHTRMFCEALVSTWTLKCNLPHRQGIPSRRRPCLENS
jgi:hypothetical protein